MNTESSEEDVWDLSCWKTDIPNKVKYVKQFMSCASFPNCCRQVLSILSKMYESSSPANHQSPALFISAFIAELIDNYLFHHMPSRLSSVQELQLLEVICQYFQRQKSEFVRWCVFDMVFSFSDLERKESKFNRRIDLLTKLVSMAIALNNGNVLDCMSLWIQKHRQASEVVVQVTMAIINEYTITVPLSLPFLENVSSLSSHFACQMLVILTSTHTMIADNTEEDLKQSSTNLYPSLPALKVAIKWISKDASICLIKPNRTFITLPSLHKPPTSSEGSLPLPLCPIQGLVQWTILEPLTRHSLVEAKQVYSELHLGVLQALVMSGQTKRNPKDEMELEPGEVMDESDMLRHLLNSDDLKKLTAKMMRMIDTLNKLDPPLDDNTKESWDINLSIDRLAQVIQVAIATGCLSSSKGELLSICKSVMYNKLLDTVVSNLDSI